MRKETLKTVRQSALSATVFFLVFAGLSSGYAALTAGLSVTDKTSSGSILSSASWNRVVDSVLELDARTVGITASGGKVGIGVSWTPSAKLEVNGPIRTGNYVTNAYSLPLPTAGSTGGHSTDPLHLKTNWTCGVTADVMYNLHFEGYHFIGASQIDASAVGYLYGSFGHTYNSTTKISGGVTASTYCSSVDNKLVFKLTAPSDWHASDLVIRLVGGGSYYLKNAADTFQIVTAVHSSSNI